MINLKLTTKYKSLTGPISISLPDFTVMTGLNGAGKTQLLVGISIGIISLKENKVLLNPSNSSACKYVQSNGLTPNDGAIVTQEHTKNDILNSWHQYQMHLHNLKTNPEAKIESSIENRKQTRIIRKIATASEKLMNDLTRDDFFNHYPLDDGMHNDVFYQNFSTLFKRYRDRFDENQYRQYRYEAKGHKDVEFLSDQEFLKSYGEAPWVFVNKIIAEARLDYHINSPINLNRDTPFELKLANNLNGAEIKFQELSSGEKVLMSLALALYNSKFDFEFPKVLLLDEPDASLHPSMAKQFLDVLERIFVKDKGVKVIITTHSPSTVALAKEENLYVMNKTGQKIEKTTKDKALKVLTAGVPSLSVNYENRRQVFVESKHDVFFYEKVYDKLQELLVSEVSLNFISSGVDGAGDCGQVKEVVNKLSGYGNKFIFGIVDWDRKNISNNFIKVLGQNKRYSIENYIFDPILISAFLLREKIISREELGLSKKQTYSDFKNISPAKLQGVVNYLTERMSSKVSPTDHTRYKTKYVNGIELEIPQWYLFHQGHELEGHLKSIFPGLKRYTKEGELKKEVIVKVIDDIPELIPNDILELFQSIQER